MSNPPKPEAVKIVFSIPVKTAAQTVSGSESDVVVSASISPRERISSQKAFKAFEEGKKFAEELINENERLRLTYTHLSTEMRNLEKRFVNADVMRMQKKIDFLEKEVLTLRQENRELQSHFTAVEQENRGFTERYLSVEQQHSDLVNLYVCMYRLHSTVEYEEVIQTIKEIVISLLGSESFGIYMLDNASGKFGLIGYEGLERFANKKVSITDGVVGDAIASGEPYVVKETTDAASKEQIRACIPLKIGNRVQGVLLIFGLVMHKQVFKPIDFELFEILGTHAATAIAVSKMYTHYR
jgi:hypothetical protein